MGDSVGETVSDYIGLEVGPDAGISVWMEEVGLSKFDMPGNTAVGTDVGTFIGLAVCSVFSVSLNVPFTTVAF